MIFSKKKKDKDQRLYNLYKQKSQLEADDRIANLYNLGVSGKIEDIARK